MAASRGSVLVPAGANGRHSPQGHLIRPEEVDSYRAEGSLRINRPLVDAAAIRVVRATLDELFLDTAAPAGYVHELGAVGQYGSVPEIIWPTLLRPELRRTTVFEMLRQVALELLEVERVKLHFDHAIFKPPRTAGPTAWHQDVVFDPQHDCPVVTVWFALVDATEENGCMMFIPGSHAEAVRRHEPYGRDGQQATGVDLDRRVVCPVPAGGLTVHMQRTLHAAGPNLSEGTRAAWIIKFIPDYRSPMRRMSSHVYQRVRRLTGASLPPPVG